MTKNYSDGGALEVFFGLSEAQALVRPVTLGYAVVAKVFEGTCRYRKRCRCCRHIGRGG